jgi:hypothetical protein
LANGGVLLEIHDSGVGVSPDRLAEMNRRLDDPPMADVSVSRHMGLFAVSHLSARHGVRVRLRAKSPEGLTALVWLPDRITDREEVAPGSWHADVYAQAPGSASEEVPAQEDDDLRVGGYLPIGGLRRPASERLTPHSTVAAQPDTPKTFTPVQPVQAAGAIATPVQGSLTADRLPMRIPQANRIPGSASLEESEAPQHPLSQRPVPSATRSAEAVRARLSGLQRGTRRAEERITRAGERADQERADH